jgi:uncharacterized caspase-like protein
MRAVVAFVLTACLTWIFSQPALAEKRVALVMGNSAYQSVNKLANPANDSGAIAETFKSAGFDVVDLKRDLKVAEMRRALRDFSDKVRDADVAVVYYAGHGMEIDGTNYVIPVDAVLERDIDAYDEAIPLDRILTVIEPAKTLRLVILDACRDNPFNQTMKRTIGSRAIGRGLAKVEPGSPNTLIAFAARAGSTASDGDGKNSPFTTALVKYLPRPGLDLRKAFGFARDDVLKATGNKQEPFVYGSLGGDDVSLVPAMAAPVVTAPAANPSADIRRDYELALQLGTRSGWNSFLATYPNGFYSDLAKGQIDKVASEEARVAATEKARLATEEKAHLAAEGARQVEQAKAAADAKAAEVARIEAEKAKAVEQAKTAAAERARAVMEKAAADKAATDKAAADKAALDKAAAAKAEPDKPVTPAATIMTPESRPAQQLASLPPETPVVKPAQLSAAETTRSVQLELRRVGCFTGSIDDQWTDAARRSLDLFNKHAGMKLDVKLASPEVLDAIRSKASRVCPLACDRGFRADGERCVKIVCDAGSSLNDDGRCEKKERPAAKRQETEPRVEKRDQVQSEKPKAQAQGSGQIFCNRQGCRAVTKGCHIEPAVQGSQREVCN